MRVGPQLRLTHVLIFSLVGVLVLAGAVLGRLGVSRAGEILEDSWRGAYDILVTHEDGFQMLSPGQDPNGLALIDDNYAAQSSRVIGFDQLERIDAIESVEVAAPVAFIGRMAGAVPWMFFTREGHNLDEEPIQDYEITWSVADENGIVFERTNTVRIDATRWTGESGYYTDIGLSLINDFEPPDRHILMLQAVVSGDDIVLIWAQGPTVATTIAAVDPVREQELIGEAADFLQPLADFDALVRERGSLSRLEALGQFGSDILPELEGMPGTEAGNRPAVHLKFGNERPLIGYVRNTDAYPSTVLSAEIAGEGATQVDYADIMRPFNGGTYAMPWPGEEYGPIEEWQENYVPDTYYSATRLYPAQLTPVDSPTQGQAAFEARMLGIYGPFAPWPGAWDIDIPTGRGLGEEISYRNPSGHHLTVGTNLRDGAAPFEVSTFTPGDVTTPGGYVPLGLYGPNTATFEGEPFPPSRQGLGVTTQAPSAIVSFDGAAELTSQEDIISAVRVRVAGLEALDNDAALTRINDTAQAIRRINGLDATVVSGATTQRANIWVPVFAHGTTDPQGSQSVGELGWIQQEFGTLGGASWTAALTNTTVDRVASASILLSSLFVFVLSMLARQERRTTHALLASQGWSARQRLGWTLREEWPGLAVFGAASALALVIAGDPLIRISIFVAIAVLILGLIIANPVRSRRIAPGERLGTRAQLAGLTAAEGVSLGITAAAIGGVGMIIDWYVRLVSQTSLGAAMTQALLPVLGSILVAGAVVVVTTAVTARKSREATSARNEFAYWSLGRSQAAIRGANLRPALAGVVIAVNIVLIVRIYVSGYQADETLYLILAGGWILIWLTTRAVSALRWTPIVESADTQPGQHAG